MIQDRISKLRQDTAIFVIGVLLVVVVLGAVESYGIRKRIDAIENRQQELEARSKEKQDEQ